MIRYLPLSIILKLARFIGWAIYLADHLSNRVCENNLKILFPQKKTKQIQQFAKQTIQQQLLVEFENMLLEKLITEGFYQKNRIVGLEKLDAALKKGKGVILLIAHFGSHLQIIPSLGFRGYTVNQVSNKLDEKNNFQNHLGFFEKRYRSISYKRSGRFLPVRMINVGTFMKPLFVHLENNEIIIAAIDGKGGGKKQYFPFLGHDSYPFSMGPLSLALRTDAAVIPSFTVRDKDDRNTIFFEDEIIMDRNNTDRMSEVVQCTRKFIILLEKYLKKHPDHCGRTFFGRQATLILKGKQNLSEKQ